MKNQNSVKEAFPELAIHEGVWEGWYRYVDVNGKQIDAHQSRLICRVPKDTPSTYHQTNHYTWENGDTDVRDFKGQMEGSKLIFDNDLIKGWAAAAAEDDHQRTVLLHWSRVGEPNLYLYEMIQISDCENYRTRVWQWLRDGQTIQRTLIDEKRITRDWQSFEASL